MISRFSKTFETNKDSDSLNFGVFLERKNIRENIQEKKKKILVIDDSADLLLVICTILELDQYEVLSAETVASALSLIAGLDRNGEYLDLILLDNQIDDLSGSDFLHNLEEQQPEMIKRVPIVFLTGATQVPDSRASGLITKPVEINSFLKEVKSYIGKQPNPGCAQH